MAGFFVGQMLFEMGKAFLPKPRRNFGRREADKDIGSGRRDGRWPHWYRD